MVSSLLITSVLLLSQVNALSTPRNVLNPRQDDEAARAGYKCKTYKGDKNWPSATEWKALNSSVDGLLERVIPPAAVCYNNFEGISTYDAQKCAEARALWNDQAFQISNPGAALNILYTNDTCLLPTTPSDTCTQGYRPEYVIVAKTKKHIAAGLKFVRKHNVRLVVRNTGHDFMGRSTGYGSLAINTHNLKDISFTKKYDGPGKYRGGAVTVGAGIQTRDMYTAAFKQEPKVVIVGGECATVGFAGGYIQGGGHGPLATYHGMGADQVLSFDAITVEGEFVTANEKENPDLFWALRGGGPSAFAIVTQLTVKTFPELKTAGTILNINSTHTNDTELFWKAVTVFHSLSNHYVDNGMFVYYELLPGTLHVQPLFGPNMDKAQLLKVLQPLFSGLDALGVPYSTTTKEFPTFFELYTDLFEPEPNAGTNQLTGGRFFNREDIKNNHPAIIDAYKFTITPPVFGFGFAVGHIVGPGYGAPSVDNAINPKWRNASSFTITALSPTANDWDAALQVQKEITAKLDAASPRGGAYVNEGDLYQPDWQNQYWGVNYPRLLKIRQKWDPEGILYSQTTPGTENWAEVGQPPKLCKVK